MKNSLKIDAHRGKEVAYLLHRCFSNEGILGNTEMPEDILPPGMKRGSLEHLLFITLTVAIDYQRDANKLWDVSRKAWQNPNTRYLFNPKLLHETQPRKIAGDMQETGLSKKINKDPYIWRTVGVTFFKKWRGNPLNFLKKCEWDSLKILDRLKNEQHIYNKRLVPDYPYLRGDKIGPLWLRMLRDNVGIDKLKRLDEVPIPVDIHVARATLSTGVVKGEYQGSLNELFETIRRAWFESVKEVELKNRPMMALDIDEPLWHLSKYGCTKREKENGLCLVKKRCEAKQFCIAGKVKIEKNRVELKT
jgi:hypothetical protein